MQIKNIPILLIPLILFSAACGNVREPEKNPGADKIKVLSSFSILSDMAQELGGDRVVVHNLVPVGMAPHIYEPKPADVKFATDADLILYNGLNLEGGDAGWLIKLVRSVKANPDKVIKVTDGIDPMYLRDGRGAREVNPHAFINPIVGIQMAEKIGQSLILTDSENQSYYEENTRNYIRKLTIIDSTYREMLGQIPEERKILMASEQAFQYLAAEYGLKEGYIWAIDTEKNGTPDQIKNAISFVEMYHPPVLFVESNVDRRPMETISKATGIPIYSRPLFSDELGKPGQSADNYLKYLEYNLDVLINGLR